MILHTHTLSAFNCLPFLGLLVFIFCKPLEKLWYLLIACVWRRNKSTTKPSFLLRSTLCEMKNLFFLWLWLLLSMANWKKSHDNNHDTLSAIINQKRLFNWAKQETTIYRIWNAIFYTFFWLKSSSSHEWWWSSSFSSYFIVFYGVFRVYQDCCILHQSTQI